MFNKPIVLTLVVTVLFTAATWSVGAIDLDAVCADEAHAPNDKREVRGEIMSGHTLDTEGDASEGSTLELRFAYDRLDEGRLH